ncbi:DddA-like double-stranded DNA deaminase toxin [Stackebrandtia soli]|uniref:DddA-like double-stranded DNA deaminase toxin n=1 Tax=Stackebrandtia soli TaxID=1892856 RepID=UPI0039E8D2A8
MASVDEFGAVVDEAGAKLDELVAVLSRASSAGGELVDGLVSVGVAGRAAEARAIVADVEAETGHAAATKPRLEAIRAAIEGLRGLLSGLTGHRGTPSPSKRPFDPTPYFGDMPEMTPKAERRLGQSIPKTHGRWVGGDVLEWASGDDDRARTATEVWADCVFHRWGPPKAPTTMYHVEMKFAAFMRRSGRTNESLVINHPDGPCEGQYGCDTLIERMLAPGSTLTVHWPGGRRTYLGRDDV